MDEEGSGATLEIIPAIDIKQGRCVRLAQGRMDQETLYYEDPLEAARLWISQGARRIHLVDLDGAVAGSPRNFSTIERVVAETGARFQVGGGIREVRDVERYLGIGVERVILGTLAWEEPQRVKEMAEAWPGRILLAVDASKGDVAVRGWYHLTGSRVVDMVSGYPSMPVGGIVYTDIQRDGMLSGPNLSGIEEVCRVSRFPVIASGGVSKAEDIIALAKLVPLGLVAIIVGKALYTGSLTLDEAFRAAGRVD